MVEADALSRGVFEQEKKEVKNFEKGEDVLKIHVENNHRKNIIEKLEEKKIKISENKLREILKRCETCNKKDGKYEKSSKFVITEEPGEIFAIDILSISEKEKIILGIDYFSRKIFGSVILTKQSTKILDFIKRIYDEFKFKKLMSDNGKEFNNDILKQWTELNGIEHIFTIPYYHQGNGRIERANRTIRTALKKTPGLLRIKLKKVIDNYNDIRHRAIGMSPNEALKPENREKVIENQKTYQKEFKTKELESFEVGQEVYLKNETRAHKDDDHFAEKGKIKKRDGNTYEIETEDKSLFRRHSTQLRSRKDVGLI